MFGVDVVALISYDQVQFTDEGLLSLTYWTIVGAYVVQGEKNDTQTMLDAAVYDIKSRKLLLRAPGTSRVRHSATPINLGEELRRDREKGFEIAATNMVANLHRELELFHERVKKNPDEIKVDSPARLQRRWQSRRPGSPDDGRNRRSLVGFAPGAPGLIMRRASPTLIVLLAAGLLYFLPALATLADL